MIDHDAFNLSCLEGHVSRLADFRYVPACYDDVIVSASIHQENGRDVVPHARLRLGTQDRRPFLW